MAHTHKHELASITGKDKDVTVYCTGGEQHTVEAVDIDTGATEQRSFVRTDARLRAMAYARAQAGWRNGL